MMDSCNPGYRLKAGVLRCASRLPLCLASLLLLLLLTPSLPSARGRHPDREWRVYGGDPGSTRYSPLDQINRSNVHRLKVAWVFHTGDKREDPPSTIECNPIVVDGTLYLTSPSLKVFALSAATGEKLWDFDPGQTGQRVSRGVAYWESGRDRRILFTAASTLYALDAGTGQPIRTFGEKGRVDLRSGLDRDGSDLPVSATTPGVVFKNLLILGSHVGEGPEPAAPGHVRAFDVRTGRRVWIFHTIPHPGEFGHDTWHPESWKTAGAANCWGGMSLDEKRGVVYLATGSPSYDFYGADRPGQNLFGDSVVALKAETGRRIWHFQTVHHDLWDYDLPCPPVLVTVRHNGRKIDAVAQVTKTGFVFVLDRETGKPLFPVEERAVPASDVEGEAAWPTQPIPAKPPPFVRQAFTERMITDVSPEAHEFVLRRFRQARGRKIYDPPSREGTIVFPGFHGGANWSGASFDPATGRLYVNANEIPWILTMKNAPTGYPHRFLSTGYYRFLDPEGFPAIKPPWGTLTSIDLNRGEIAWQIPLGDVPELSKRGVPQTGTENFGGSIVTAGGLVFIGATKDRKFRALDKDTGKILWETQLEAGGNATPSSYEARGKQYVVIAAGGGFGNRAPERQDTVAGDAFVAYALP
jgi:quinoprotein glucose dehydrogenase